MAANPAVPEVDEEFLQNAMDDADTLLFMQQLAEEQEQLERIQALEATQAQLAEQIQALMPNASFHVEEVPPPEEVLEIQKLIKDMVSLNVQVKFEATEWTRKILSEADTDQTRSSKAQEMIDLGMVEIAANLMASEDCHFQYEGANILGLIVATKLPIPIAHIGPTVTILFRLLKSPLDFIVEKAASVFGHVAGIDSELRSSLLLEYRILDPLLPLVKVKNAENVRSELQMHLTRTIAWLTHQLVKETFVQKEMLEATAVASLPILERLVMVDDSTVLRFASWAVNALFKLPDVDGDGNHGEARFQRREAAIESRLMPRIVDLLGSNVNAIIEPCLRTVNEVITGNENQFNYMVKARALPYLRRLINNDPQHGSILLIRIAVSTAIDLCSSSLAIVQGRLGLLFEEKIISALINVLKIEEAEIRRGTIWILASVIRICNPEQLVKIIQLGFVEAACNLLMRQNNCFILEGTLLGLLELLKATAAAETLTENVVTQRIQNSQAVDRLFALRYAGSEQGMETAKSICDKYFQQVSKDCRH